MELSMDPAFSIKAEARVLAVAFSPYEWSRSLIAVAFQNSIAVHSIKFKEEKEDCNETEYKMLWEWQVSSSANAIAWSPSSTLHSNTPLLQVLLGSIDHSVKELSSNLSEENCTVQNLLQHNDCVNSVAYNGDNGSHVASTGDDLTARIWERSSQQFLHKFLLTSPGMVVQFHAEDPDVLLVGEKCGVMRMYRVGSGSAALSLRCPGTQTLSADWSMLDPMLLVCAGSRGLTVWNLSGAQPRSDMLEVGGGEKVLQVALCRSTPGFVATHSPPSTVRVTHLQSQKVPVAAHLKVFGGMTWHQHLPYLAVGSDRSILFWKIDNI